MKKTGNLEKDFKAVCLYTIATGITSDSNQVVSLIEKANKIYKAQTENKSGSFYKITGETKMRNTLNVFMKHWNQKEIVWLGNYSYIMFSTTVTR